MNSLVVYDSAYGNTARVAQAIAAELGTEPRLVGEITAADLDEVGLLVVGSPTQGGRATRQTQEFIKQLPALNGVKVAAFDTRFDPRDHGWGLRLLMKVLGFAAEKIERQLTRRGGEEAVTPLGFIVGDREGPLLVGELNHARHWASEIKSVL